MKKRKKNNKPLIILIIGLLLSGVLICYSVNKINENKIFLEEDREEFEKNKEIDKDKCEKEIEALQQEITAIEQEIDNTEKEITSLEQQQTDEFMTARGFSDRYYAISSDINNKQNEVSAKRVDVFNKKVNIETLNSTIKKIELGLGNYQYKQPDIEGVSPYFTLVLGIIIVIITLFAFGISLLLKNVMGEKSYSEYNEIDQGVLSEVDVKDGKLLKKELYTKLESLLIASANRDYDAVRKLCTKNMARSYTDEIDLLKKHNQKLVIKDIENVSSKIISATKGQNNIKITIVQKIKLYDYTEDINGKVISGSDSKKQTQAFKLVFVKDSVKSGCVKKCYNCGAIVKDSASVKCDYCGTVFDTSNYDWYLESKLVINED